MPVPSVLIRGMKSAGANMNGYKTAIFGAALVVVGGLTGSSPALAQTFDSYHCADGTRFIVGFFKYDKRAHLQIGGRPVTLAKRLARQRSRGRRQLVSRSGHPGSQIQPGA